MKRIFNILRPQHPENESIRTKSLRPGSPPTPLMTEAAGLALGAVALVSLFQTAVDFLEYSEVARNLKADQELATTKINQLEVRLKQWGRDLRIEEHDQEWDGWLRMQEGGLITNCLVGISDILGSASELTRKYGPPGVDSTKRLSSVSGSNRRCNEEPLLS